MDKKAQVTNILILLFLMVIVLFLGLIFAFGTMTIDYVADEIAPEITNLGQVGDANLTEYAEYTITPLNTVVQSFTWLSGVLYFFTLVALLGLSFMFRIYNNKWMVSLFFIMFFLLIVISIFVSNIYEEYYTGDDEIAVRLQQQTILSFLILYSPLIMSVIGGLSALIMFTGEGGEYE